MRRAIAAVSPLFSSLFTPSQHLFTSPLARYAAASRATSTLIAHNGGAMGASLELGRGAGYESVADISGRAAETHRSLTTFPHFAEGAAACPMGAPPGARYPIGWAGTVGA
jgi:hypothetical protein